MIDPSEIAVFFDNKPLPHPLSEMTAEETARAIERLASVIANYDDALEMDEALLMHAAKLLRDKD